MITRGKHGHLMAVNGIVIEEMAGFLVYLARAVLITPHMEQSFVHGPRP